MQKQRKKELLIYIDTLVEFLLRSGDIDNRRTALTNMDTVNLESKARKKIISEVGSNYTGNYPLQLLIPLEDDHMLKVKGKADGILHNEDDIIVDEIKCIFLNLDSVNESYSLHLSEAKCYAYIYSITNSISEISIQITYFNVETEEFKKFRYKFTFSELEVFFTDLINSYKKWALFQIEWTKSRQKSIQNLEFPFAYRAGQRDFAIAVYKSILRKKNLFVQAPTGIGKTISNIFPAVKAVGEGLGDKIFYLTAKNVTQTVAKDTFHFLSGYGLLYKVLEIASKEKICFSDEIDCNPQNCIYAKGHYDRINEAIYDTLISQNSFTKESISEAALRYQVCPYLLCLDLSVWVDAIICDYNYVFAPNVQLTYFFNERVTSKYIFLIDEAHNLVDRGRDMYSASLYREDIVDLIEQIKPHRKTLKSKLEACNKYLKNLQKNCKEYRVLHDLESFHYKIISIICELENLFTMEETWMTKEIKKKLLNFYFDIGKFLYILDQIDHNYIIYCENVTQHSFKLKLFCVNASNNLQHCIDRSRSSIFFSATLLPINYYKSMLSTRDDNYAIYIDSPFDTSKRLLLIAKDVSTKYTRRNESEYKKIVSYIHEIIQKKSGNYMIFFPSFQLLTSIYDCFIRHYPHSEIEFLIQERHMTEDSKISFLQNFKDKKNILGFCVMGGVFSEGIDLKGDSLIGSLIVGTGLPQICTERELIKNYYDKYYNGSGFQYGYLYPAINKVLQASGRVIRTMDDYGVILLLDERFQMAEYTSLFPREWYETYHFCTQNDISCYLETFWNSQ